MPMISMVFGYMMIMLGTILYSAAVYRYHYAPLVGEAVPAGNPWTRPLTALIPAAFGVALLILGAIARRSQSERARMHTMHGAALVGVLGLVLPLIRVAMTLVRGVGSAGALPLAGNILLALLSLAFVVLCAQSFRAARRARQQQGPPAG